MLNVRNTSAYKVCILQINTTGSLQLLALPDCWGITTAGRAGAASSKLMAAAAAATLLELHHNELHNTDGVCSLMYVYAPQQPLYCSSPERVTAQHTTQNTHAPPQTHICWQPESCNQILQPQAAVRMHPKPCASQATGWLLLCNMLLGADTAWHPDHLHRPWRHACMHARQTAITDPMDQVHAHTAMEGSMLQEGTPSVGCTVCRCSSSCLGSPLDLQQPLSPLQRCHAAPARGLCALQRPGKGATQSCCAFNSTAPNAGQGTDTC
jgi:hypothetical protein